MGEQELNRKLAEWAGMPLMAVDFGFPHSEVMYSPPNFTQSLDACFKWLAPKLFDEGYAIIVTQDLARACAYVRPLEFGRQFDATDNHNPALAFCLATEKLIDKEK